MLSNEIERVNRSLKARAIAITRGSAGPMILDLELIIEMSKVLEGWVDMADAMERAVVPEKFKTAEVVAFPLRESGKAAAR